MAKREPGPNRQHWPLGNVLVATDFSLGATHAVTRAALLPITPGSALTILHVVPDDGEPRIRARADAEARRALDEAASVASRITRKAGRSGVHIVPRLVRGTPFVEIVRRARPSKAELVVLGRHGTRAFRDLLLGSTAERVVRKGDISILVVSAAPAGPYRHPLVAVDLSATSPSAFELALRIAAPRPEHIEVVHAYDVPSEAAMRRTGLSDTRFLQYRRNAREQARFAVMAFLAACGDAGRGAKALVSRGDARRVILETAARRRPDLLVVGTHGRSGLAHALLGSVAEAVIRAAVCDVLVARRRGFRFKLP